MKVLLLGDASNYHASLAAGLAAMGHHVTVASEGSRWMNTRRDIDISRRDTRLGGALLWLRLNTVLARDLRGYDVVQLCSPGFVPLRPARLLALLKKLKRTNGHLVLSALGTDSVLVRNLTGPRPALRYSEWHSPQGPTPWSLSPESRRDSWLAPELADYTARFYDTIDGAVSALYEYHRIISDEYPHMPMAYGGLPIDISALPQHSPRKPDEPLRMLFAAHRGREAEKGADILLPLLRSVESDCKGMVDILTPPNMPYANFVRFLAATDMVSDQLYAFTPATTALLAAATGSVAITGAEPEFFDFIGEPELRPFINPDPADIEGTYRRIRRAVENPDELSHMAAQGRIFVEKHHSADVVANRFSSFWESL